MDQEIRDVTQGALDRIEYIERMSQELGRLAVGGGFPVLGYILEMASEEAALIRNAHKIETTPGTTDGRSVRRTLGNGR